MSIQFFDSILIFIGIATLLPLFCVGILTLLRGKLRHSACRLILLLCAVRIMIPMAGFMPTLFSVSDMREQGSFESVGDLPQHPGIVLPDEGGTGGENGDGEYNNGNAGNKPEENITFQIVFDFVRENVWSIALLVWGAGALLTACNIAVRQAIISHRQKRTRHEADGETQELFGNICDELGISRRPALYTVDAPIEPHICGIFRPTVYLGSTSLSEEELYNVLCHELTHHKHGDVWVKLFSAVVITVFWWNPAPRLLCRKLRQEIELCCDETVLYGKNECERLTYGETILKLLKDTQKGGMVLSVGISSGKSEIVSRFDDILVATNKRKGRVTIAVFCLILFLSSFIIGCRAAEAPKASINDDITNVFYIYGESDLTEEQLAELARGIEIPKKEGMHMSGWDVYVTSDEGVKSILLSPVLVPNTYNVTLQPNGGSVGDAPTKYGEKLPDAVREGYTFGGWFLDMALTQRTETVPAGDVTLYARWKEETETSYFDFSERGASVIIRGYTGRGRNNIVVPAYIGGKPVTAIGANCFAENGIITSVTLPHTVSHIGAGAFRRCYALKTVNINGKLSELDASVFNSCYNISKITLRGNREQNAHLLTSLPAQATIEYKD